MVLHRRHGWREKAGRNALGRTSLLMTRGSGADGGVGGGGPASALLAGEAAQWAGFPTILPRVFRRQPIEPLQYKSAGRACARRGAVPNLGRHDVMYEVRMREPNNGPCRLISGIMFYVERKRVPASSSEAKLKHPLMSTVISLIATPHPAESRPHPAGGTSVLSG